jgi:ribosomal protein L44E
MAKKEVVVLEWKCDGCGTTHRTDKGTRDLPPGWNVATTKIDMVMPGGYSQALELCPACSRDPDGAVRRYKANIGR